MSAKMNLKERRQRRLRYGLRKKSSDRIRLSVFRSSEHIYAQLIDDKEGRTLAAASSLEKEIRASLKNGADCAAAAVVGKVLAERGLKAGVESVVFDRGPYLYHGRVKALAEAARAAGLAF